MGPTHISVSPKAIDGCQTVTFSDEENICSTTVGFELYEPLTKLFLVCISTATLRRVGIMYVLMPNAEWKLKIKFLLQGLSCQTSQIFEFSTCLRRQTLQRKFRSNILFVSQHQYFHFDTNLDIVRCVVDEIYIGDNACLEPKTKSHRTNCFFMRD